MITSFSGIQQTMEVLNSSEFHLARSGSQILFYITSKALAYLTSWFRERGMMLPVLKRSTAASSQDALKSCFSTHLCPASPTAALTFMPDVSSTGQEPALTQRCRWAAQRELGFSSSEAPSSHNFNWKKCKFQSFSSQIHHLTPLANKSHR